MRFSLSDDIKNITAQRLISQMERTAIQSLLAAGIDPDSFEISETPTPISKTDSKSDSFKEKTIKEIEQISFSMEKIKQQINN